MEITSIDREVLFEYIRHPMAEHNPAYRAAAERCIELFLEYAQQHKHDFMCWFKLRHLYAPVAQYGLARTTSYHSAGHNKLLIDLAEAYKEVYVRVKEITSSSLWDNNNE